MTDYEFLIEHSFSYLRKNKLLCGEDLRKKKNLKRDHRLIRYGKRYDFNLPNYYCLNMTFISENGVSTTIYDNTCLLTSLKVPIFSFKPQFLKEEIFYIHDVYSGYPSPESFKDIINRISSVSLEYSSDIYIISKFLEEEDPVVAFEEETGMKLNKFSSRFSRLVKVFHNSPVKPENLRELIRLDDKLWRSSMDPDQLTEEDIIKFMKDNVRWRARRANEELQLIMEGVITELSLKYEIPESLIGLR